MRFQELRSARVTKGLTQAQAAMRLRVSQSYLAMLECGDRPLTPKLTMRAVRFYGLPPTVLPHFEPKSGRRVNPDALACDLAGLGYPGFSYLQSPNRPPKNPGDVLLVALSQENLEARLVEALPWLVLTYWNMDREWLVDEAKRHDLQNRLGFVVTLACQLAERAQDHAKARALTELAGKLEQSRLLREDTLGKASLPESQRRWLREHRSAEAKHWNVLTDWTADALRYVSA